MRVKRGVAAHAKHKKRLCLIATVIVAIVSATFVPSGLHVSITHRVNLVSPIHS